MNTNELNGREREIILNINGLDYVSTGKNKMYFVNDVAQRLIELKNRAV